MQRHCLGTNVKFYGFPSLAGEMSEGQRGHEAERPAGLPVMPLG